MQTPRLENSTNKRRLLLMLSAILGVVFLLLGLAAVVVDWVGTYFVPVAVILGVLVGSFGLLVWGAVKLHDSGNKIF